MSEASDGRADTSPVSRLIVLFWFAVIIAGYLLLNNRLLERLSLRLAFSDRLEDLFRLGLPDDVILGGIVLAVGVVGFVWAGRRWLGTTLGEAPTTAAWRKAQGQSSGTRAVLAGAALATAAALVLAAAYEAEWVSPLLLIGVATVLAAWFLRSDRREGVRLAIDIRLVDVAALVGLLAIGAFLLTYRLGSEPERFWQDEWPFLGKALDIARGLSLPSPYDLQMYGMPVSSQYVTAAFLKVFGVDVVGWRLASVAFSLLAVMPQYFLLRDMFDRRLAVLAGCLTVTSAYFLAFSRLGYDNTQAIPIVTLAVLLAYWGAERSSRFYLLLAGLATGVGFYTYLAARLALLLVVGYLLYLRLRREIDTATLWRLLVPFAVGVVVLAAPQQAYVFAHAGDASGNRFAANVFFESSYARGVFLDRDLYAILPAIHVSGLELFVQPELWARLVVRGTVLTGLAFFQNDLITGHMISSALPGPLAPPLLALGTACLVWRWKDRRMFLLLLWLAGGALVLSALNARPPRQTHLVVLIPVMAAATALGVIMAYDLVRRAVPRLASRWPAGAALGLVVALAVLGPWQYFGPSMDKYPPDIQSIVVLQGLRSHSRMDVAFIYPKPPFLNPFPRYAADLLHLDLRFRSVPAEDFLAGRFVLTGACPTLVLVDPAAPEAVGALVQAQLPAAETKSYRMADGRPLITTYSTVR